MSEEKPSKATAKPGQLGLLEDSGRETTRTDHSEGLESKCDTSKGVAESNSRTHEKGKRKKKRKKPAPREENPSPASPASVSKAPEEEKSSFEAELEWCVCQLQLGMLRSGASGAQKQQNTRHIQTLQSTKAPLPKKRQLMRQLFGDYRTKMKTQPIPESFSAKPKDPKVEAVKPEEIETVGTFFRKSVRHIEERNQSDSTAFKFNFDISSH